MQPSENITPATANTPAEIGTAAGAQAITGRQPPTAEQLQAYTLASLGHVEATVNLYRAEESHFVAMARAHRADPFLSPPERETLAAYAEARAENAARQADQHQGRADALRADLPIAIEPMAVITITVQRDRIQETARLIMGGTRQASRSWERRGEHSWRSRDPDWSAHENRIGVELADYLDALSLPDRVAAMLPRPARMATAKASSQLQEVANA